MNGSNVQPGEEGTGFFKVITNRVKFNVFLLRQLPAAFFSGLRVVSADSQVCHVSVPFKWFTKNPFRSTYFACLSMAAEMSTGILAMAHVYRCKPSVSMLITANESTFHKKATGLTIFSCEDGMAIKEAITRSMDTSRSQTFTARSTGRSEGGELVAEFLFTWSFKVKGN